MLTPSDYRGHLAAFRADLPEALAQALACAFCAVYTPGSSKACALDTLNSRAPDYRLLFPMSVVGAGLLRPDYEWAYPF